MSPGETDQKRDRDSHPTNVGDAFERKSVDTSTF